MWPIRGQGYRALSGGVTRRPSRIGHAPAFFSRRAGPGGPAPRQGGLLEPRLGRVALRRLGGRDLGLLLEILQDPMLLSQQTRTCCEGPFQSRKDVPRGVARRREDRRKAWRSGLRFHVFCGARSQTKTRDRRPPVTRRGASSGGRSRARRRGPPGARRDEEVTRRRAPRARRSGRRRIELHDLREARVPGDLVLAERQVEPLPRRVRAELIPVPRRRRLRGLRIRQEPLRRRPVRHSLFDPSSTNTPNGRRLCAKGESPHALTSSVGTFGTDERSPNSTSPASSTASVYDQPALVGAPVPRGHCHRERVRRVRLPREDQRGHDRDGEQHLER